MLCYAPNFRDTRLGLGRVASHHVAYNGFKRVMGQMVYGPSKCVQAIASLSTAAVSP